MGAGVTWAWSSSAFDPCPPGCLIGSSSPPSVPRPLCEADALPPLPWLPMAGSLGCRNLSASLLLSTSEGPRELRASFSSVTPRHALQSTRLARMADVCF